MRQNTYQLIRIDHPKLKLLDSSQTHSRVTEVLRLHAQRRSASLPSRHSHLLRVLVQQVPGPDEIPAALTLAMAMAECRAKEVVTTGMPTTAVYLYFVLVLCFHVQYGTSHNLHYHYCILLARSVETRRPPADAHRNIMRLVWPLNSPPAREASARRMDQLVHGPCMARRSSKLVEEVDFLGYRLLYRYRFGTALCTR